MKPTNSVYTGLPTTIFEEMSRLAIAHKAVNLGQGFPDVDGPEDIRRKAAEALMDQVDAVHVIHPDSIAGAEQWIARAEDLLSREAHYQSERDAEVATPAPTGDERLEMLANMAAIRGVLPKLRRDIATARTLAGISLDEHSREWLP